jgi:hypothetical protein
MSRKRLFPICVIATLAVCATASTPAAARWVNPATAGYCAWGTCNRLGGIRAANVKFCKAEHCRDYAAVSPKTVAATRRAPCQTTPATIMFWPWNWISPRRDCGDVAEK